MIKLIATDMDGTFLNNLHEISKENMDAVEYAREQGIEFVIATGRAYYEALQPVSLANLECDLICFNGGVTYNKKGEITNLVSLPPKDAYYIAQVFKSLEIPYQLYTKNAVYTSNILNDIQAYVDLIESHGAEANREKIVEEAYERKAKGYLHEVDNVDLHINDEDNPLIKIVGISMDREKLKRATELLVGNEELSVTSSGANNVEVMPKRATKGEALKNYAQQKNISLENTLALGDNLNDLAMIEVAGYSVAMKNGNSEIKEVAKYISDKTNDESGVGDMITKLLKKYNGA